MAKTKYTVMEATETDDAYTFILDIMKNSDGEYEIDTASFEEVGEKLFDISGLEL